MDNKYWDQRYIEGKTGWDAGSITLPIKTYIDQLQDKQISILIPGSGLSYEAEYIYKSGFKNVHILDYSAQAVKGFQTRYPDFPQENIHIQNIFEHSDQYDLILEQTCFCALSPELREPYIEKISTILKENGKYVGLLFDFKPVSAGGPPYGGDFESYQKLLSKYFQIIQLERCHNSIEPRQGNELWFSVKTKKAIS